MQDGENSASWIAEFARQVTRMLPGGVWVIGVYAYGTASATEGPLIEAVKLFPKNDAMATAQFFEQPTTERLLLHISTGARKFTLKSIDVSQPKVRPPGTILFDA